MSWKALLICGLLAGLKFAKLSLAEAHREHKVHNIVLYPDKHSWCKTTTIKQVVNYPGCTSVEIDNNVCVGGCFSYSIPHMEPSDPGEVIVPYCDSCQPSETTWRQVTLKCDDKNDRDSPSHLLKHVQIIQNCSCTPCEKNYHNSISSKFNNNPEIYGDSGLESYDDPPDDLLSMQGKHQHYQESIDQEKLQSQQALGQLKLQQQQPQQQQKQKQQPSENSNLLDSMQSQTDENASVIASSSSSSSLSVAPLAAQESHQKHQQQQSHKNNSNSIITDSSSNNNDYNNTSSFAESLNEQQHYSPATGRWKKIYALTYALIKKVQLNNTRQDREQLIDMLNLLKTSKPAGIIDFIDILQKDHRPLDVHEMQRLNDILMKLESSKFHRKHLEMGKHNTYYSSPPFAVQDVVVSRASSGGGGSISSTSTSEPEISDIESVIDSDTDDIDGGNDDDDDDDDDHDVGANDGEEEQHQNVDSGDGEAAPEEAKIAIADNDDDRGKKNIQKESKMQSDIVSKNDDKLDNIKSIDDERKPDEVLPILHPYIFPPSKEQKIGGEEEEARNIEDDLSSSPAVEHQEQREKDVIRISESSSNVGGSSVVDGEISDDGMKLARNDNDDHPHGGVLLHHHHHHQHHHVNENIVPHGHLTRGPHGALVIEPDRIHEKLDVNVHELKPNRAGTLLSYHSHSDESKKP